MHAKTLIIAVLLTIMTTGCGRASDGNPVEPADASGNLTILGQGTGRSGPPIRYFWGFWTVSIDADHQSADVIPLRAADMHFNVLRLLQESPCKDCLSVSNVQSHPPDELSADLTLKHPFPGVFRLTGFDVRGVFISGADYTFPVSGRRVSWTGDHARLLNADGYTTLFNPTEYPETLPVPRVLKYIPGHYAPGGDLSATLNPFLAYAVDNPRRMFGPWTIDVREVRLQAPPGPLEFGYAVDACWVPVDGDVVDPITDFPPEANCLEAYRVSVEVGEGIVSGGGSAPVRVEICDHQGLGTIGPVTIEAPELFTGEIKLSYEQGAGEDCWVYSGMIPNELGAGYGAYPVLVRVADKEPDANLGPVDAWQTYRLRIKKGWARTWGGPESEAGSAVAADSLGNAYVTGCFQGTVDFDAGPETDYHTSNGDCDAYMSSYDSNGVYRWTLTFGCPGYMYAHGAVADDADDIYLVGDFIGPVDFDPGPGIDEHTTNGKDDIFLSKFNSNGEFQWARTWGGAKDDVGWDVACDDTGNTCVTG